MCVKIVKCRVQCYNINSSEEEKKGKEKENDFVWKTYRLRITKFQFTVKTKNLCQLFFIFRVILFFGRLLVFENWEQHTTHTQCFMPYENMKLHFIWNCVLFDEKFYVFFSPVYVIEFISRIFVSDFCFMLKRKNINFELKNRKWNSKCCD